MMLGFAGVVSAQKTATTTTTSTKTDTKLKPIVASTKPAKVVKMDKPVTKTPATTKVTSGPTKADGTLDKRFKVNKTAATTTPTGPLTKEGKPDMRYKTNNPNAGKTKEKSKS